MSLNLCIEVGLTKGGKPYPTQLCRDAVPTLPNTALALPLALTCGQSEKLSPQEQLALAFGLENLKPPPIILSE